MSVQRVIPLEWLPVGRRVDRIVLHWTAGRYSPSDYDRRHYHCLIDGEGHAVRGGFEAGQTAPSTRNLNTGTYAISIAAMFGAREGGPYGEFPMTRLQYERAAQAAAEVVAAYDLAITPGTVLSHEEVTYVYGPLASPPGPEHLRQRGRWDVSQLPWERPHRPKREVWYSFRSKVAWYLKTYHGITASAGG
jgi:hypothetical protein